MNIFILDLDPAAAARALCDRHVVKMVLETAQILSTVSWERGIPAPYRATHRAHPCVRWAGAAVENWRWAHTHGLAIADEYERRYGRTHASRRVLEQLAPPDVPVGATPFVLAMPEAYRCADPVASYRAYYRAEKRLIATWRTAPPGWWS